MTTTPIHVLGISGSLRRGSYNTGLLYAAAELLPEHMRLEVFDLAPIPMFNQDLEMEVPEPVRALKAHVAAADALLIATPEYNYSISGVLKNAIDWASRPRKETPLQGKPLAIIGAGGRFGTARAQMHLRQIAVHLDMHALNRPELLVPFASEKFNADGRLVDAPTREQLAAVLEALAAWTRRLRGH
jgi:chromate reductase